MSCGLTLVVLYTGMSSKRFTVKTKEEGKKIIENGADYILDYYWEGQQK